MKILLIGDIFGAPGLRVLRTHLGDMRKRLGADFVIANGENAAGGFGITIATARDIFSAGVDAITLGNHVWDKREMIERIGMFPNMVRPFNLPPGTPGRGWCIVDTPLGSVGVLNLLGRIFMDPADCPFRAADAALAEMEGKADVIVVDFHAEATSEKMAMGHYLDGRVSAVVGTHTHVPTADATLLPGGSGYLTDVGMTGVQHSIIGLKRDGVVRRFLSGLPISAGAAEGRAVLMGVFIETAKAGKCTAIRRVDAHEA